MKWYEILAGLESGSFGFVHENNKTRTSAISHNIIFVFNTLQTFHKCPSKGLEIQIFFHHSWPIFEMGSN